ncbi:MAG: hypothetical protein JWN78_1714 [Bacteroidota bacterium]|nr:hypothetical protein [Bacteroidota bacterium]
MRKQVVIYSLLSILVSFSYAQTDVDALRYAMPSVQGTARNIGLGNTMGTIGADVSALSTNPAGIAKFSSTEFTLSPAISINKSTSDYLGNSTNNSKVKFQLTNFGIVVVGKYAKEDASKKWNGIKFGFGLNRLANYNDQYYFSGFNNKNSLLNAYAINLSDPAVIKTENDAATLNPFDASIAYQLGLLSSAHDSLGNIYTSGGSNLIFPATTGNMQQDFSILKSGGMNELAIGFGSAFKDKLMIGASIGIPIVNYTERVTLKETETSVPNPDLNSFTNESVLKTRGVGFNLKVGIIAMPVSALRISLAVQTPGILFMRDQFATHMEAEFDSLNVILTGDSPEGNSKYKYVQPWKLTAGVGYIHKFGLISVEYELSDAGNSKFKFSQTDAGTKDYENYVNNQVKTKYGLFHTIKAGVEFKYKFMRLRGGVQYRTSPFKNGSAPSGINTSALTYSAGIGYRGNHFFTDLTYVQTNFKELYIPYQVGADTPSATLSTKKPAIVLTIGYKL